MRKILPIILIAASLAAGTYLGYKRTAREQAIAGPALTVSFLDAGRGNAVVVRTPEGKSLVIDPGPERSAEALVEYLRHIGARQVSVLISKPDADHSAALDSIMESLRVERVFRGEQEGTSRSWRNLIRSMKAANIPETVLTAGRTAGISESTTLEILSPPEGLLRNVENSFENNSLVTRISFKGKRFLVASDARTAAEAYLIQSGADLRSDVLAVARHGRFGSTSLELLREVRPEICVVRVGTGADRPSPHILSRIDTRNTGADLYRTDEDGIVHMTTDGRAIVVDTGEVGRG